MDQEHKNQMGGFVLALALLILTVGFAQRAYTPVEGIIGYCPIPLEESQQEQSSAIAVAEEQKI